MLLVVLCQSSSPVLPVLIELCWRMNLLAVTEYSVRVPQCLDRKGEGPDRVAAQVGWLAGWNGGPGGMVEGH